MSGGDGRAFQAVVGTAGHIDHGKSSLVKNLTGTDPDRLKEERERGLTIDLGYAEYRLADGREIGLIDVPGHEKFVRNMVAGATGIDAVMLVVAADDGVMPQTREHLDILGLLGVSRGFVVLTKCDLVDADTADFAELDVREAARGTFLEDAPVVRCSNTTGAGLDAVRTELERTVSLVPPRDDAGALRLAVQRSFTVKGHGTVVTGVPVAGAVAVGDEVEILPSGTRCRVRGIHVHHRPVERAGAGRRVALNLSDVGWKDVARGDVVCTPGLYRAATMIETRLRRPPGADRPLPTHAPVKFLAGCSETTGRLVLLDCKELAPGAAALAQIRLDEPVAVAPGDAFLVRSPSPERTLGGGVVLGETRFRQKASKAFVAETLVEKERALGDDARYLEAVVRGEGLHPTAFDRLPQLVHAPAEAAAAAARELATAGVFVLLGSKREVLHRDAVAVGATECERALLALHEADHYAFGFGVAEVAAAIRHPVAATEAFLAQATARRAVERQGDKYRLRAFKGGLSQEDRRLIGTVEERLRAGGFASPSPTELAKELDRPEKRILNLVTALEATKRAKTVAEGVVLHADAIHEARRRLVGHCEAKGELTSNDAKTLFGATRKYVIPLLEHFDAVGITVRKDSSRTLKPGHESREAL